MNNMLHYYRAVPRATPARTVEAELCIYGGTSAGVAAAVVAARLGVKTVLVEFGRHVGGLSSGGLGATDIGNKAAIGGLAREFYRALGRRYGRQEAWTFEPGAAEAVFERWLRQARVPVFREHRLAGVRKQGNRITELLTENGNRFRARMFIDATYEGDLLAAAGVAYHVGREANSRYDETLNGIHLGHPGHNFKVFVDPYVVPGRPASGLLPGIVAAPAGRQGAGDRCVQAYNFRLCMTDVAANRRPFPKPAAYDPDRYTLLARYIAAGVWDALSLSIRMPNGKTDTNNHGGFSSDNIGMNYDWPDGDYATRERIFQDHVTYQQGLMWFLSHDRRVPAEIRADVRTWGLPKDEFRETGGWPHQLYIREARRMIGDYVMTEHNCVGRVTAADPVGLAAYTMDSHNCRRIVMGGRVKNEGNVEVGGFTPYPISYRSIVPRERDCANLLVPVCLAASHIAYGSIRMEPVFLVLGESAALAAAQALASRRPVQDVPYRALRKKLEQAQQILEWTPPRAWHPIRAH